MSNFDHQAKTCLKDLYERIDHALGDRVDCDLVDASLTLTFEDGRQMLIHIHRQNKEIWFSSPQSGATHFHYDQVVLAWVSKKGAMLLQDQVDDDLFQLTGVRL